QKVQPIPGNVPDVIDLPPGCVFAPRCSRVTPTCSEGPIPMFQTGENCYNRCLAHVNFKRDPQWSWEHIVRLCNE
ncbi:MAG: hypothetical protein GYA34_08365, partial [Chloroflexi bacterium]|nr:hypothetical protein [Chloroflexota bacterium]